MLSILALFLLPIAARAALYAYEGGPGSWRTADWSSTGSLPAAAAEPEARVLIMSGRTGGWKGVFSVHSWVVFKPENGKAWRRYDVVGWGDPVRTNCRDPDGRWYGNMPQVVLDLRGEAAAKADPEDRGRDQRAINYANAGDYRIWPGPNSNTFVATVLRAIPEAEAILPANAVGRDFRPWPYAGLTDSGTGVEASLWGVLGVKLGWVEGVEMNFLGLVAGLDLRNPGVKLPGFGRIGLPQQTAMRGAGSLHVDLHRNSGDGGRCALPALPPCTTPCRCWRKSPSRRSAAGGSTPCRSTSAIAATSPACIATSARARTAPRR